MMRRFTLTTDVSSVLVVSRHLSTEHLAVTRQVASHMYTVVTSTNKAIGESRLHPRVHNLAATPRESR